MLHDPGAADLVVAAYAAWPHSSRPTHPPSPKADPLPQALLADVEGGLGGVGALAEAGGAGSCAGGQAAALKVGGPPLGGSGMGEEEAEEGEEGEEEGAGGGASLAPAGQPSAPFAYQSYVLAVRMWRHWLRSPMMLAAEAIQYAFLAVFIGLVYLR